VKRELDPGDAHLWAVVTATVRPLPGRTHPVSPKPARPAERGAPASPAAPPASAPAPRRAVRHPGPIEPRRRHRLAAEREPIGGRIDLHGMDQDEARSALTQFLLRGHEMGRRSVLVITGKGALGAGVLRRRVPEWLAAPPLRSIVAGLSEAHGRHGGEGALYVAIKRAEGR